jgi:MFS family permease
VSARRPTTPRALTVGLAGAAALVPLNSTMVAVALADVESDLGVGLGAVAVWLVSGYLAVAAAAQPLGGRVGDRLGHRGAFTGGLVLLLGASLAGAAAPGFAALVVARLVQAVAGGLIIPAAVVILRDGVPPARRGRAYGWFGATMAVGAAVGPVLGGGLVDAFGWRATFLVNVPAALAALALTRPRRLAEAAQPAPHAHEPLRRHLAQLMRRPPFLAAAATVSLHTLVLYGLLLLVPLIASERLGLGAGDAGLLLSATTGAMIVAGPVGGALGDRAGRRVPALAGSALLVAAVAAILAALPEPPVAGLAALLGLAGLGLGLAGPSLQATAVESAPPGAAGLAGGLATAGRYAGGIVAAALVGATGAEGTYGPALAVVTAVAGVSLVACAWLPGAPRPGRGPAEPSRDLGRPLP